MATASLVVIYDEQSSSIASANRERLQLLFEEVGAALSAGMRKLMPDSAPIAMSIYNNEEPTA